MKNVIRQCLILLFCLGLVITISSCGGGGSDGTTQSTGTVGILLTDAPADPSLFTSIYASIETVELMGDDDQGRVPLYTGPTKTVDLLKLKNESIPFTFKDDVPVGTYCKIRLTLSDLELVLTDGTTDNPKLPGNGKLDLVAKDCFEVGPGEVVTIQVDVDAGKSIHIVENKNGFNFRPVVFVDVMNQDFDSKLVRVEGEITKVDEEQDSILLCDAIPTQHTNTTTQPWTEGCVAIHLGNNAAFFDNVDFSGEPRPLSELYDKVGQVVTVVGWSRYGVEPYSDVERDPYHPLMALDALAVELGDFLQVRGKVAEDADPNGFSMNVSAGSPVITDDYLSVIFQDGEIGVNGTRIVSKSGVLLDRSDIVFPLPVQVDGVLELISETDDQLNAALIIVDTDLLDSEQVTGTVLAIGTDTITVAPDAEVVCGEAIDELTVHVSTDAEILTVIITDVNSEIIPGGILEPDQLIGMNGDCTSTGYQTDNIVIVDDQRE